MNREIMISEAFANAKDAYDLVETLNNYKEKGIKYLYLGYNTIPIERLIKQIVSASKEGYDLRETYQQIYYQYRM